MTRLLMAAALLLACVSVPSAQQARDGRTPVRVGRASITGLVVSDDRNAIPLRRVRVSLTGSELAVGHMTITADDGTFRFDRLPAGRYSVTATKDGYVPITVRPQSEQITSAEVREGDAQHVTLRLMKGAVITGTVTAPDGTPAANAPVTPMMRRFNPATGERRLTTIPFANTTTDDRGVYRIYGLAPGSYVIASNPRLPGPMAGVGMRVITEAEVRRALAEVKEQTFSSKPGYPTPPPSSTRAPETGNLVLPVPIYHPGTPSDAQAVAISVGPGETRSGVDIDLHYVRAATIEGFVTAPAGARPQVVITPADSAAALQSVVMSNASSDGRFTFRNVAPGHYAITARATPGGWGRTEVIVSGDDISGITVPLRPPIKLSGRVRFDGTGADVAALIMKLGVRRVSVPLSGGEMSASLPAVEIDGDQFTVELLPIRYRLQALPQGMRAPIGNWWLTSISARGRELLDDPLEFTEDVNDAVITFSDRASQLSGTARYASGSPVRDGHIVIFSTNPRTWFFNSRRVVALQTSDGRYTVKNLPAGEYFVTFADGLERNEWFDPDMLGVLAKTAQRVTLAEFETKTFDVVR